MQIVLTIQLQQDNGTPVFTGTQTKTAFSPNSGSILTDFNVVSNFLVGGAIKNLLRIMCWIAAGQITLSGTPTVVISSLGDASGN